MADELEELLQTAAVLGKLAELVPVAQVRAGGALVAALAGGAAAVEPEVAAVVSQVAPEVLAALRRLLGETGLRPASAPALDEARAAIMAYHPSFRMVGRSAVSVPP